MLMNRKINTDEWKMRPSVIFTYLLWLWFILLQRVYNIIDLKMEILFILVVVLIYYTFIKGIGLRRLIIVFKRSNLVRLSFGYIILTFLITSNIMRIINNGVPIYIAILLFILSCIVINSNKEIIDFLKIFSGFILVMIIISIANYNGILNIETNLGNISLFTDYNEFCLYGVFGMSIYFFIGNKSIVKYFYSAIVAYVILLSGSRRSIIFFVLILIFYAIYRVKISKLRFHYKTILKLLLTIFLFIIGSNFTASNIQKGNIFRIYDYFITGKYEQQMSRYDIVENYLNNLNEIGTIKFIMGQGVFSSMYVFKDMNSPHNYIVTSLYDSGIIGFVLIVTYTFIVIYQYIFIVLVRSKDSIKFLLACIWTILIWNFLISGSHILYSSNTWLFTFITTKFYIERNSIEYESSNVIT